MNEGRTTAIFAGVAAVTLGFAYWSMPRAIDSTSEEAKKMQNMVLFEKFDEPGKAASLQIVKYNESLAQLDPFEISKDKGGMWKIPSHDDYPADAAEQVRDAATPLIGLRSLDMITTKPDEHGMYGVLNPDDKDLKIGESGVGMLVRVKDASDTIIADLIIGKADKDRENQRYVRKPSEDAVYIAEISTAPFTTEFRKWIKGELLGVKSFEINSILLRDYAILPIQNGRYELRKNFDADLSFDAAKSTWALDQMLTFESGPPGTPVELGADQELKAASLNDLRTAVQSLEIVNVQRKPKGLAADLKADKSLMENKESLKSLFDQGFFPKETPGGFEIFATGGETIVGTQNGVQYVLRFGEVVATLSSEDEDKKDGEIGGLQRYLLVTAKLDDSKFPLPDIQPLPETIEDLKKLEGAAQSATTGPEAPGPETPGPEAPGPEAKEPAETTPIEPSPVTEKPPEPPTEEAPKPEPSTEPETEKPAAEPKTDAPAAPEPPAEPKLENALNSCDPQDTAQESADKPVDKPAEKPEDKPAVDTPAPVDEKPAAEKPAVEVPAGQSPDAKPAAQKPETEEELKDRLAAARERIAKENQRKIDDRKDKIAVSQKKVQELNARFSDWYYVVSDSAYKKLKISRDQLIVPKGSGNNAPPAGGAGMPPAFPGGFPAGGFPQGNR